MLGRLKLAYKAELEALKAGQPFDGEVAPRKKGASTKGTPKRKGESAGEGEGEDGGRLLKKGRKAVGVKEEEEEVKEEPDYEI